MSSSSREVRPAASGVSVLGAWVGSSTSMSMEIYNARLPTHRRNLTMISPTLLVVERAARVHVVDALGV